MSDHGSLKIERWQVKYIVATCGLIGLYLGGILGVYIFSVSTHSSSGFLAFLFGLAGAVGLSALFLFVLTALLGPKAKHVSIITVFLIWVPAAFICYVAQLFLGWALGWSFPAFLANAIMWGAGVAGIWVEEP